MPVYKIEPCACGNTTVLEPKPIEGSELECDECGRAATKLMGSFAFRGKGISDGTGFNAMGIDFNSRWEAEQYAEANNLVMEEPGSSRWKDLRDYAGEEADARAREAGFADESRFAEARKDSSYVRDTTTDNIQAAKAAATA